MASLTPENPQATASAGPPKKRTRLNPARRKAAKAKADAEKAQITQAKPSAETISQTQPKKVVVPTQASNVPKQKLALPAPLPRQNSEPVIIRPKPPLARTITAPGSTSTGNNALALKTPAIVTGGLVGCAAGAAVLLGVGLWYDFAGAESAILTAKAAKLCIDNLSDEIITSLKAGTYSADEALDMLRRTTLAYASTIPEGAPFVERIFREIDTVRKQRGREIDAVVVDTYAELSKAGTRGATPAEMRSIVVQGLLKLSTFASKATQDVVARNPKLRPYRDAAASSLRGPSDAKVPTMRVNMAVRQKLPNRM